MQEQPQGPSYPKPWYYRPEYMLPMFIMWPAGSLLAIRSPWNTNVMFGGVAWAFVIVGGFIGMKSIQAGSYLLLAQFFAPGILLTIITQVQWAAYQKKMTALEKASNTQENQEPEEQEDTFRPRPSARRRRRTPKIPRSRD
ncbi:MAG TPA: hypothetical protein EYG27_05695 [Dehalococcoidia bacterium]|nr:hypothetical protein [Dehalococcoidia bacterium]HIL31007.1 hypothetical protein [Dehalococcoidia bacterium]